MLISHPNAKQTADPSMPSDSLMSPGTSTRRMRSPLARTEPGAQRMASVPTIHLHPSFAEELDGDKRCHDLGGVLLLP